MGRERGEEKWEAVAPRRVEARVFGEVRCSARGELTGIDPGGFSLRSAPTHHRQSIPTTAPRPTCRSGVCKVSPLRPNIDPSQTRRAPRQLRGCASAAEQAAARTQLVWLPTQPRRQNRRIAFSQAHGCNEIVRGGQGDDNRVFCHSTGVFFVHCQGLRPLLLYQPNNSSISSTRAYIHRIPRSLTHSRLGRTHREARTRTASSTSTAVTSKKKGEEEERNPPRAPTLDLQPGLRS